MGSFGRNLRRERELRGISVDEIAQHTKISVRMLEAIESDRFELLPGGVFNRSFVMHYAHYVGLDEDQVAVEFDLMVGSPPPVDVQQVAAQREKRTSDSANNGAAHAGPRGAALTVALGVLLLLGAYAAWQSWWPGHADASAPPPRPAAPAQNQPAPAAQTVAAAAPTVAPAGEATAAGGVSAGSARPEKLRLQVDTMEPSWVIAWTDGQKSWEAQMGARETRTLEADSGIRLRVGNAGVVVLTLNGETQPPLGRKGEVKTVTFTARDLKPQ